MELDLLGDLLVETLKFLDSGFDPNLMLHDETTFSDLPAGEMFRESGGRWFLRTGSMPGDLSIMAVGIDTDALYLETAPIDPDRTNEMLAERKLPFIFDARRGIFLEAHRRTRIMSVSKPIKPEQNLCMRGLCRVPLKHFAGSFRRPVIMLLDALYSTACFVSEEISDEKPGPAISQQIAQRLQLGLQQRLAVEQRPLLALRAEFRDALRPEIRMELRTLLALEHRLISMEPEELANAVAQYVASHGEERTRNILLFVIAGQIKRSMPKLTWKQSRHLARRVGGRMQRSA